MNRITFGHTRHQASAAMLALTFTLGTLLSLNLLATPSATELSTAASAASAAKVVSQAERASHA